MPESKKETIYTLATLFYVIKNTVKKLKPNTELNDQQVDTLVFNKLMKRLDR